MTMPHMSSGGSEDFYSTDEVKVYKDEGNKDEEKRSSENLTEEKLGLVTESEEGKNTSIQGNFEGSAKSSNTVSDDDKAAAGPVAPGHGPTGSLGFFIPPYASAYPNGAGKFGMVQPPYPGLVMYNDFAQPPPAHKGYSPVYTDPKTGLPRPPMYAAYPAPPGQFPHPLYSPEFTSASWHRPGYPLTSGAFAGSFPPSLSSLSRYGPPGLLSHPGLGHPGIPHPASLGAGPKSELMSPQLLQDSHSNTSGHSAEPPQKKKNHIKKPLNAFMLFMKEQRPKVIAECTLRESSAINQILGRRWHALDRSEQAKYYEMARKEKELHLQLYPGWSARDNYAAHQKKKKRKKDGPGGGGGNSIGPMGSGGPGMSPMGGSSSMGAGGPLGGMCMESENKPDFSFLGECPNEKKCRARYGMEQQSRWCKPCRRKKKCIRYKQGEGEGAGEYDDDDDTLLRNRTLDSSVHSGCESDSTNAQDSPLASRDFLHKSDSNDFSSPLSPLVDDKVEAGQQTQPLCLVTSSSPQPHLVKRPTPHTVDSFLSSPPPLRLQFPFPQSPLSLPYIGFPPFHHYPYPISPHAPRIKSESPYSPTS
ncbi:transcription factor 7-like 2 isoform X3 [Physella acuta]|uniref:transcription factor 7-like 2 isoform X3 n=1 Tax=Physella acuta TaxID=109671 RepID=UPI0027DBD069|nr:transcription factor 7-like 2 isoform X3 [Physella acuta]